MYCRAAAAEIGYRGDIFWLGHELSGLRERSADPRERAIASALTKCFYERVVPFRPPFLTLGLGVLAGAAAVLAFVRGDSAAGVLLCFVLVGLLARIAVFYVSLRYADDRKPVEPPPPASFLKLRCIQELPDAHAPPAPADPSA